MLVLFPPSQYRRTGTLAILLLLANLMVVMPYGYAQPQSAADKLFAEAEALRKIGTPESYRQAIATYEEVAKRYHTEGKLEQEASSILMIGLLSTYLGDSQNALDYFQQALRLYRAVKARSGEAITLNSIGNVYYAIGEQQKALEYFQQAQLALRGLKIWQVEGLVANNIGLAYSAIGDKQKALGNFQLALLLFRAVRDRRNEATTLNNIGLAYAAIGEPQKALEHYQQALSLSRMMQDRDGEALTLISLSNVYSVIGEPHKALEYYQQALTVYRAVKDRRGEATTLNNIGLVYSAISEPQKALDYYEQALPMFRAEKNKGAEATTLNNIGFIYYTIGVQQKALEYFQQALPLFRAVGDRQNEATTLNNIGLVYSAISEPQKALEYYEQALPMFRAEKNKGAEATTLNNIGLVYSAIRERQKALEYFQQALPLFRAVGDRRNEATTLNNSGLVYSAIREPQKALECFQQALPLLRAVGDRRGEATTLNNFSFVYSSIGELQKALEHSQQALSTIKAVGDRGTEATTLNNIGFVYLLNGDPQKALDYFQQALPLLRTVGNREVETRILGNIGFCWYVLQESRGSSAILKLSLNLHMKLRNTIQDMDIEAQRAFSRSMDEEYIFLSELLLRQGRLAEAVQVLNLGRDQEFFDTALQRTTHATTTRPMVLTQRETIFANAVEVALNRTTPISQQLTQLQAKINTRQPSAEESTQLKQLNAALDAEAASFQKLLPQLVTELRASPEAENRLTTTTDLTDMQHTLHLLQQRTGTKAAAIYALIGAEEFRTLLVTADAIAEASSTIKQADLNQKVQTLLQRLQSDQGDPKPPAKELYDVIFKPIEVKVQKSGATLLLWSLDRNLRALPMAALWDGRQYLVERYQHAVFTRSTPERMLRDVSRNWTGVGFGTSKEYSPFEALEGAAAELRRIFGGKQTKGILPGTILEDEGFTKQAFLSALKHGRPLVHIASHFNFKPGNDVGSYLLLGDGSQFTLAEMKERAELFKGVELLTLSACQTADVQAEGKYKREIDSFAETAQRLGAGAVMASLWRASDESTPELMAEFYRLREAGKGMTKAQALQQAQIKMLRGDGKGAAPYTHPFYWAPFILIGNWR